MRASLAQANIFPLGGAAWVWVTGDVGCSPASSLRLPPEAAAAATAAAEVEAVAAADNASSSLPMYPFHK